MASDGTIIFNRPPRPPHELPKGLVEIPRPPVPEFKGTKMQWTLLLAPVILGVLTVAALLTVSFLRPGSNVLFALATMVSSLGFVTTGVLGMADKLTKDRANKQEYIQQLADAENVLRDYRRQQQTSLRYLYPDLSQIVEWPQLPNPPRLWERRTEDQDFMMIRMGIGSRPSSVEVRLGQMDKKVPMLAEAQRVANEYRQVSDVPDITELFEVGSLGIVGNPWQTSALIRSMICHLSAHHSPEDVKLMATYAAERREEWFWLGWLPHTLDDKGNPRLASHSDQLAEISNFMIDVMKRREIVRYNTGAADPNAGVKKNQRPKKPFMFPCYIWVIEDFELVQDDPAVRRIFEVGAEFGIFLVISTSNPAGVPERCRAVATIRPNGQVTYEVSGEEGRKATLQPDMCDVRWAEQFALSMAPLQLKAASGKGELPLNLRMLEMEDFGVQASLGEQFDPLVYWNRSSVGTLKAPIGRLFGGQPLYLDISDKGHGPHGIIAGTTGSGKSELLLTIVSALALENSPDNLNFILGDFKGGLAFNPFKTLPHVVGMMSNLDLTIVERAMTALFSELQYRQRLLDKEGVAHIRDYQRKKPRPETPMPYLMVIIDEFAEMKEQAPDFMEKIVNIARLGRTLGVHMVLATQRPAGVVTGQLNSNTNFRLCLRVVAPEDSADMLGRKDAFLIPSNRPGRCFIKVGSDIFEQFQVARVAIPFGPDKDAEAEKPGVSVIDRHWSAAPLLAQGSAASKKKASEEKEILPMDFDVINDLCVKAAARMTLRNKHKPWLDPMGPEYFLPAFLEGKGFDENRLVWPEEPPFGYGIAPVAFLDDVVKQEQRTFFINLLEEGSYCISGLAQSGKTNALRAMITSLAVTHKPDNMSFYILDMGGTLRPFAELPHKTRYVGMAHAASLKGVIKDLYEELNYRKQLFAERGVLDITTFRSIVTPEERVPSIFIAFDNYATIRHNPPYDIEQFKALVREGRSYGMHVAMTMDRGADFEFGRMAGQFVQIALRQAREDIMFPVPKNMIGSWNGVPGRSFIKIDQNKPPVELQLLLPCQTAPEDQTRAIEELVKTRLQKAAQRHPVWAHLNDVSEPAPAPAPVVAPPRPAPVQAAPTPAPVAPVAATAAVAPGEAPAEQAKPEDKSKLANQWNELFSIDDDDKASYIDPDTGLEVVPEPAPKKSDNQAKWDDLFSIEDDDVAVVLTDEEIAEMRVSGSLPARLSADQPAATNGNGNGAANGNGNGHSEELPVLYAPPKPRASADGEKWSKEMGVDNTAAVLMPDSQGGNRK
ncbi:MAG: hypothetical protein J0I20_16705 [Chloroflexi bacterium]|nr:hypothetical protein [Chloroflexota bacterium]OJV88783.1 MAG: hypothetical protein BGO39_04590 [Chloroflexi bacterium 54-19]